MEIGVFTGENARTMVEVAIQNVPPDEVEYYGFDFFRGSQLHLVEHKLKKTGCKFKLFKGDTVVTLPQSSNTLPKMDLIFIDGGKSYTEAKNDWEYSKSLMHDGTAVFVHNYQFSGVRRTINTICRDLYRIEIIHLPYDADTAWIQKKISDTSSSS